MLSLRLVVLAAILCFEPWAVFAQQQKEPALPAKEVIAAWENNGFWPVWFGTDRQGWFQFNTSKNSLAVVLLPGLGWNSTDWCKDKPLKGIPDPKVRFGIEFDSDREVTDADLKELARFKTLSALDLSGTQVTNAGLKDLTGYKSLFYLNLNSTQVTDAGLKDLAGLKKLSYLNLGSTKVTDAGLKEIAAHKGLRQLSVGFAKVTDSGMKELGTLEQLSHLDVSGNEITDAGLKTISGLRNLTSLSLHYTKVTDKGVEDLQKALPRCQIEREPH